MQFSERYIGLSRCHQEKLCPAVQRTRLIQSESGRQFHRVAIVRRQNVVNLAATAGRRRFAMIDAIHVGVDGAGAEAERYGRERSVLASAGYCG